MMRRAKIVATIGPACSTQEKLEALMQAGMDVARLNFSHGTQDDHARHIALLREISGQWMGPLAIVADLAGPKIRTGALASGKPVMLRAGGQFTLATDPNVLGDATRVSVSYPELAGQVRSGDRILLADGLVELRVEQIKTGEVLCRVVAGGELGERKGVNLPGVSLRLPSLTEKDQMDLKFVLSQGVDYIALSFVRKAEDVLTAKRMIAQAEARVPVIAKLEKPEAIENLEDIMAEADGVMVARGDLGVELAPEKVPMIQKRIIEQASAYRTPVITATQMLESMTEHPRPTRAEASDVANAILDGSDAVMLSAETAVGRFPVESVAMMERIIREAEAGAPKIHRPTPRQLGVAETIAEAVCHAADALNMKCIAVFTESGSTARLISKYRPKPPVIAFSPSAETRQRMALFWGVLPRRIEKVTHIEELTPQAEARLLEESYVQPGDVIAIVAGTPFGIPGTTNFMKLHTIGSR
jgi:pyruvate kinase